MVMPENPTPAAQSSAPGEFEFNQSVTETPRIKRRSLKSKQGGSTLKPADVPPPAARELEREAPPLAPEEVRATTPSGKAPARTPVHDSNPASTSKPAIDAPPKVTPSAASPTASRPSQPPATSTAKAAPASTTGSATRPAVSPHGTRPATLYYSTSSRKEKEATPAMKTTPTAPASTPASTATPVSVTPVSSSASATRPAMTTSSPRTSPVVDYRANVERQSREQKSVGSILAYVVYALIAFFVLSAALAGYGAKTIFDRLRDQSATVTDLNQHYAAVTQDLSAKLATTQQSLTDAQAQIARQQDLILKQQDQLNRTLQEANANVDAIRQEKQSRAQETASLRSRVRDLENRQGTTTQRY